MHKAYQQTLRAPYCQFSAFCRLVHTSRISLAKQHSRQQMAAVAAAEGAILEDDQIWPSVLHVYDKAQVSGAATKTETQTQLVQDEATGINWVLRLATALKAKPGNNNSSNNNTGGDGTKKQRNPFLPPEPELTVGPLSNTHTLVLNKFNVVEHHCLVITKDFQSQGDPLNEQDLHASWRLLAAMPAGLAFYNCGSASGRSQPHKHLQVVPLPFAEGLPAEPPIQSSVTESATAANAEPLQPFKVRKLPWQSFAAILPTTPTPSQLATAFNALLAMCRQYHSKGADSTQELSYNILLTKHFIMLAPRSNEFSGQLSVNALGFAGTILVKDNESAAYAKNKGPSAILKDVGFTWTAR